MFAIRINDKYLDLAPNTAPTITIVNPLFDRDGAERLYTYTFRILNTPNNTAQLRHAHRLDNHDNTTTYTGAVLELVQGVPFEHGILDLDDQEFGPDGVNAVFRNTLPDLAAELGKIKINQILETITTSITPPIARWTFAVVATPPLTVNMTLGGELFVQSFTIPTFPDDYADLAASINAEFPGLATATASNLYLDSALLELHPLESLVNIVLIDKVTPAESVYEGFKNHVDDVNWNGSDSHCWPAISWPGFYKEASRDQFWDFVNPWLDGVFQENLPRADKLWASTFIPFVFVKYVLERIAAQLPGYITSWSGFLTDDPDGSSLIIFNNQCLDALEENFYDIEDRRWLNRMVAEVDLNRHVPEMSAKEFLDRLLTGFGLWFSYNGSRITFHKKVDQLRTAAIDWTHLSTSGHSGTRRRRRGIELRYPDLKEDQLLLRTDRTQLLPVTSGEGWNRTTMPFHSLVMASKALANLGAAVKLPTCYQPGSSNEAGLGQNEYSFRLLFFRGISLASSSDNYIMASHDATDYHDDPNGALSLDLQDTDLGLYEKNHRGLLQLVTDGTPITKYQDLSLGDITLLRSWSNSRRKVYDPDGEFVGIIKSIQFKPTATGIGLSKVEFVKQP